MFCVRLKMETTNGFYFQEGIKLAKNMVKPITHENIYRYISRE